MFNECLVCQPVTSDKTQLTLHVHIQKTVQ